MERSSDKFCALFFCYPLVSEILEKIFLSLKVNDACILSRTDYFLAYIYFTLTVITNIFNKLYIVIAPAIVDVVK